jgi:hypothetical protein
MSNKNYKYLLMSVLIIGVAVFLVHGYHDSHRKYANERVWKTCNGEYVTARSLGPGINGGGPCLVGLPYTLKNDNSEFYISIAVFGVVVLAESVIVTNDLRKKTHKRQH